MMHACMESVLIQPAAAGTTVIMTHTACPVVELRDDLTSAPSTPADAAPSPPPLGQQSDSNR
jgi:hypothetical protein